MAEYAIRPLSPDTWPDFAGLAERHNGCRCAAHGSCWTGGDGCWCIWFQRSCAPKQPGEHNRDRKERLVSEGRAHAALVFDDAAAVAWCQYGRPDELPDIYHRREYEAGAGRLPDYRLTCLFVDKSCRRRGIGAVALRGALDLISLAGGGVVEAYPQDTDGQTISASFLYNGTAAGGSAAAASAVPAGELAAGGILHAGEALSSSSGNYALHMQADGNLVLYPAGSSKAVWATGTASPGAFAQMQTDGNFVIYSAAHKALWSSGTASAGAFFAVQTDGNVVVYSSANKALWDRSMFISEVPANTVIASGDEVVSASGNYVLRMQADGNLVLYPAGSSKAVWGTMTASPGATAVMQADGNLVIYSTAHKALWGTGTSSPGAFLEVQADGNVVVYSSANKALWDRSMVISEVPANTVIASGDEVVSASGNYALRMQADGNLVLYPAGSSKAVWGTGTASPGATAVMQADGNLVIYSTAHKALWGTGTSSPGAFLEVQADGNVVVYSSANKALWSRTGGLVR